MECEDWEELKRGTGLRGGGGAGISTSALLLVRAELSMEAIFLHQFVWLSPVKELPCSSGCPGPTQVCPEGKHERIITLMRQTHSGR